MMDMTISGCPDEVKKFLGLTMDGIRLNEAQGTFEVNNQEYAYWVKQTSYECESYKFGSITLNNIDKPLLTVYLTVDNLSFRKIQDAKAKVANAQQVFKQAQRELSKLQEKGK